MVQYTVHPLTKLSQEVLPSLSKVAGFGEACLVPCCDVTSWASKFGNKRVNDWIAFRLCSWNCMLARLFGFVYMKIQ